MTEFDNKTERLEEAVAHLARTNEELSSELTLQWKRVEQLETRLKYLESRFEELETENANPPANVKPPHW